ncbi:hypothetical protein L3X38_004667 [Prunus dulcis]|uniref:Uncharacterized protein n=1 Tax=Prunus dulcis TaxID=3755 RepID=A0AAD4ZPG9_PRUDU|nr:hypothetical protein L3X38_004667 [Prunus dulcis]
MSSSGTSRYCTCETWIIRRTSWTDLNPERRFDACDKNWVAATRGGRGRGRMRGLGRSSSQPQPQPQAQAQAQAQAQTEALSANIQGRALIGPNQMAQHVVATRGGTSRGRMRGLGRSSSQPQPHALPPNIQGSTPIGLNQMAQLVAATRGGRGRGRGRRRMEA